MLTMTSRSLKVSLQRMVFIAGYLTDVISCCIVCSLKRNRWGETVICKIFKLQTSLCSGMILYMIKSIKITSLFKKLINMILILVLFSSIYLIKYYRTLFPCAHLQIHMTNSSIHFAILFFCESPFICKLYRYCKITRGMKRSAQ
jgi:hypothetical protein